MRILLGVALLGLAGWAAEAPPTRQEQERFLAENREAALKYTESLPDFICTQKIQRFSRTNRTNWKRLDSLTVRLTNSSLGEEYKLVEINGATTDRSYESIDGATSRGEFRSLLRNVFDPQSAAEFHFEGWTSVNGSGEVVIDRETHAVLRITSVADKIPRDFAMRYWSVAVTYDCAVVGGRSYLLPSKAISEGRTVRASTRNETEFLDYQKFTSGSVITFGTDSIDKR